MACQQLRSTSLPVRPHALVQELEDVLQRLRSGASASAPPPSPSPAALAVRLGDAYGRIEELVGLPGGRDALSSARWRGAVEAALDLCERARDAAASAKQHARAARSGEATPPRSPGPRCGATSPSARRSSRASKRRRPTPAAVRLLSEAVAVAVAVLQRAMASLSARAVDTRRSRRWCAVSRLLGGGERPLGVCRELDGEDGTTRAQETLQELEDSVEAVENGLEHLFRQIVKSRVALLNVLTL